MVPETDDAVAGLFEKGSAGRIIADIVLATVSLDNQPALLADEVDDEGPNRLLTSKLGAPE